MSEGWPVALSVIAALVADYYITTLVIWWSHWFAHRPGSPLGSFHLLGHHLRYPNSRDIMSPTFRASSFRYDSVFSHLPWLALQCLVMLWALPLRLGIPCALGAVGLSI